MAPKKSQNKDNRDKKFIELMAQGNNAYQAALKAGYSEAYAKAQSYKLLEKYRNEIEQLKPVYQEAKNELNKEEYKYTAQKSIETCRKIQEIALLPNGKGDYTNLPSALKAEEMIDRLLGLFEEDNKQKSATGLIINVNKSDFEEVRQQTKDMFDE